MSDCPVCGTRLDIVKWRWITNVLGLTKPYFICPNCKWKMTVAELHKRGGLERVKYDNFRKAGHKRKNRPHRRKRHFNRRRF